MAEPRPQATCTENLVTSGHLVSNNYTLAQTGIETYMQTDTLTAILRSPTWGGVISVTSYHALK